VKNEPKHRQERRRRKDCHYHKRAHRCHATANAYTNHIGDEPEHCADGDGCDQQTVGIQQNGDARARQTAQHNDDGIFFSLGIESILSAPHPTPGPKAPPAAPHRLRSPLMRHCRAIRVRTECHNQYCEADEAQDVQDHHSQAEVDRFDSAHDAHDENHIGYSD
jgi:hypothetical protein